MKAIHPDDARRLAVWGDERANAGQCIEFCPHPSLPPDKVLTLCLPALDRPGVRYVVAAHDQETLDAAIAVIVEGIREGVAGG